VVVRRRGIGVIVRRRGMVMVMREMVMVIKRGGDKYRRVQEKKTE
jgi:hypothetical protein